MMRKYVFLLLLVPTAPVSAVASFYMTFWLTSRRVLLDGPNATVSLVFLFFASVLFALVFTFLFFMLGLRLARQNGSIVVLDPDELDAKGGGASAQ